MDIGAIWERLAHVGLALALLGGWAVLAGTMVRPSISASTEVLRVPVALSDPAPGTPDAAPPACDAR